MKKYDVLIIGCGVVGAMTARECARYKLSVCVLEKENDVSAGASKANSGIIHGGFDPIPGTEKAKLNAEGIQLVFCAAKELDVPYRQNGSMVVAFDSKQEEHLQLLLDRGIQNGIEGLKIIDGDEARKIEPKLSLNVTKALVADNAGIVSPYELCIAAMGNAMDNGAELRRNFAVAKIRYDNGFALTSESGEEVCGNYLVNCAGVYADEIAAMAGDNGFHIIPRAGEYLLLDKNEGETFSHTVFGTPSEAGKGILISPTAEGNLLLGPTAETREEKDDTDTSADGLDTVMNRAKSYCETVNLRAVITSFAGVRATVSGGDFHIAPSPNNRRLIHAVGIDSPGLTCCVAIAKRIVALLGESGLPLTENESFNPYRKSPLLPKTLSADEKNALIAENPLYGKIICRCEKISEGEIRAAARQNPKPLDSDGVKRRTRASMGRCQGGFCTPQLIKILAEELGISKYEVTKKGNASAILAKGGNGDDNM